MKQTMTCPKCRAGKGAIYNNRRFLECGTVVMETSCLLCGYVESQPVYQPQTRVDPPRPKKGSYRVNKATKPCTLEGCERTYNPINSKYHLCMDCVSELYQSRRPGRKKRPVAFIRRADRWIINPELTGAES